MDPKPWYDVIVVGGGGHGLATACYLARNHGIRDVAVLERGWLGGGNVARNTTIIRSNYLWDRVGRDLRTLAEALGGARGRPSLAIDLQFNANRLNDVDAERLSPAEVKAFCPIVNVSPTVRYPVLGATLQRRGGVARHDKVAWGFARGADRLGVHIVEHCEVTGFLRDTSRLKGRSLP